MTAISRFDITIANLRRRGRQTMIRPKEADYEHTRAFFSPPGRLPSASERPGARRQRRRPRLSRERES